MPIHYYNIQALASCTTSVYVNLSKNSFFNAIAHFFAKAGAKVLLFFEPPKLFHKKIQIKHRKIARLDKYQSKNKLYIIIII